MIKGSIMKHKNFLAKWLMMACAVMAISWGGIFSAAAQKPYKIGFMIWNASIPFYSNLIRDAKARAEELGVSLDIQSGNGDLSTEISLIQQFIAQKVDMILVTPSNAVGIAPIIKQANEAGIPVIAVNNRVDTSSGAKIVTFVGADDFTFGQKQGELLVKAVGQEAKIAYIIGKLGTSPQINRKAGLLDALQAYPNVKIVEEQTADWDNAKALAVVQDFLSRYPVGSLDAILVQGPEGVTGANFVKRGDREDVKFILGDYPADVRSAIQSGAVYGTINQDPGPQGSLAVEDAVLWLDGKQDQLSAPEHYIELMAVTAENVDQVPPAWGE